MKKALAGAAALVLLVGAAGLAFVLYRKHQARNIRGSSTVEFVTTQEEPQKPRELGIQWPMYGYDQLRQHVSPWRRLRPPLRPHWIFKAGALIEFPPAVAYRQLYFANGKGVLYALDTRRVRVKWAYRAKRCTAASPAVAEHIVYMTFMNKPPCNASRHGLDGQVVALEALSGKVVWRQRIGPSETSPLVANGVVYVGDWNGRVYAFSARTGRLRWSYKTGGKIKGGAALLGNRLYVGSYDHHLYAINARTGQKIWRAAVQKRLGSRGRIYSTPAVAYGRVYVGSTDRKVYSFGARSGKLRWSHGTGGYVYGSPALFHRLVLIGSYDQRFYALDAATGDVRWKFKVKGPISGGATVVNGVVYFSTLKGRTYALDARTGRHLWTFRRGAYAAVVADKRRVYLVGYSRVFGMVQVFKRLKSAADG